MNKMLKKTMAAALALTIIAGGLPTIKGGISVTKPGITASAADIQYVLGTLDKNLPRAEISFNESTGVLLIGNGWLRSGANGLSEYKNNPKVKKIEFAPYCGEGTDVITADRIDSARPGLCPISILFVASL